MQWSSFNYLPPFFLLLAVLLAVVVFVLQIGILGYAYEKIGIRRRTAYLILLLSLLGSYVNIPVADLRRPETSEDPGTIRYVVVEDSWGFQYAVPKIDRFGTQLALNVGGAIVPTVLSIYLMVKNQLYIPAIAGTAFVAAVVHYLAEVVPGMGVTVPIFAPPIVSAGVAMLLSRYYAAPVAYISGCMGTLIGADLMNLGALAESGASVASIGGAGTFDGVFLTGMLAVLLAVSPRPAVPEDEPPPNYR
jgi:uncharacterized membrane protein